MSTDTSDDARLCGIAPRKTPPENGQRTRAVVNQSTLWDNGSVLNYSFFGGTTRQQKKVDEVIKEWMWYAHITFKRVADKDSSAILRITFNQKGGSWSYVGRNATTCVGPEPTINFGWVEDTDTTSKRERGVILHEFGHVLGLMHEHESPARSGILRLKEKEIIQYYKEKMQWDEKTTHKQVLNVYAADAMTNFSQFDNSSIMIYAMPPSMNHGGVEIFEVTELSAFDKAFIVANYPLPKAHKCAPQWTPQFALVSAGVDADAISAYLAAPDVESKRVIFKEDTWARRRREAKPLEKDQKDEKPLVREQRPAEVQHMANPIASPTSETTELGPVAGDGLACLAALIVAHPSFKPIIVEVAGEQALGTPHVRDEAARQFRNRADSVMMRMWERMGPRVSEHVLGAIEHQFEGLE